LRFSKRNYNTKRNILIIYNQNKTNIDETLTELGKQQKNIKFTIKRNQHNSIDFLEVTIHHKKTKLEFTVYKKHTQVDILIATH
jgi:hypothetical protein